MSGVTVSSADRMTEQLRVRESPAVMGEGGEEERKRKMVVCSVGDGKINGHKGGGMCSTMQYSCSK